MNELRIMKKEHKQGFTIVELLIVIVVIAILAAITVVAYNGIQTRTHNAQTAAVIKMYKQALIAYATTYGNYPAGGTTPACLGEGYTSCWGGGSNPISFHNDLRPFLNNTNPLPKVYDGPITYGAGNRYGASYYYTTSITYDGVSYPWGIAYYIEGANQCPVGPIMTPAVGQTYPNFSSTPDPARQGYTERQTGNTHCRIMLPDPATL